MLGNINVTPNSTEIGDRTKYGQTELVPNLLSTREKADNISTQLLNAATSTKRITWNLNSLHNNSSATYTGKGTDLVARVTNFESDQILGRSDKEFVELLTRHIDQKPPSIESEGENSGLPQYLLLKNISTDNSLGETSNCGNSSFPKRLAITLPGYGQSKLVSNQLSTIEAAGNISTQLLNAATSSQQLITENVNSVADT
ncbi:hypothetical protein RND71_040423 [Anisodus tanguticus]|uniref:Uncharacterized protein n=1 Tax=Anisodus tanguticus TaxID=243964 RepID=A0AAE1QSY5_9SOLA|nr:hypothetical protein RND71_040423 [Anisodus tanguticus]